MGLFFSSDRFTRPGPGVRPDAPRKKGVARLAEIMGRDMWNFFRAGFLAFLACLPAARRFGLGCHLFRGGSFGLLGLFRPRFWFLRGFCILGFAFLFLRARFAVRSIAIAGMGFGHSASLRAWSGFALRALPAPGFGLWLLRRLHRSLCYLLFVHRFLHQHLRFIVALRQHCTIPA